MIIIPYKRDSAQRKYNLQGLLNMIKVYGFDCEVIETTEDPFHKTKLINDGIKKHINDTFTVVWDCDCRISKEQFLDCTKAMLYDNNICLGYPFKKFLGVDKLNWDKTYEVIDKNVHKKVDMSPTQQSYGGVCIMRNSIYKDIMENEKFMGWCPEDMARAMVVEKLGYSIISEMERPLYHIEHPRPYDQGRDFEFKAGWTELQKMYKMTQEELKSYVKRGYQDELLGDRKSVV